MTQKLDSHYSYCKDFLQSDTHHPQPDLPEDPMADQAKNWEDVKSYTLDPEDEQELFDAQIECTLIWSGKEGGGQLLPSTVTEDTIRELALPLGLVDIKVCAVSDVWSGLKLVIRKALR